MQSRNIMFKKKKKNEITSEFCSAFITSLIELILREKFDYENVTKIFLFKNNLFEFHIF